MDISGGADKVGKPQAALYVSGGLGPTVYPPDGSWEWALDVWMVVLGGFFWWTTIIIGVKGWPKRSDRAPAPAEAGTPLIAQESAS